MTVHQNRLVCLCNHVSFSEIKNILRAGAVTVAEIQQFTSAGTGCGRCRSELEAILVKHQTLSPKNQQIKIKFE